MLLLVLENLLQISNFEYLKLYVIKWYMKGQIPAMSLCVVNLRERVICKILEIMPRKLKAEIK